MRLIDADALLENLKKSSRYFAVKFDIDEAPTIDPKDLLPHGRWENGDREGFFRNRANYICSNCKSHSGLVKFNFCPNCGARMDGE